ncbi:MAG: hypothetical protein M5R40_22175 [Anaerolineae bacterium]|nr:hypothetical protein [Anaerolineae bacterium]
MAVERPAQRHIEHLYPPADGEQRLVVARRPLAQRDLGAVARLILAVHRWHRFRAVSAGRDIRPAGE